jgi:hypothetical protein
MVRLLVCVKNDEKKRFSKVFLANFFLRLIFFDFFQTTFKIVKTRVFLHTFTHILFSYDKS